jgi:phage terminase Nu1 subunit (DNA packaging protein)
MSQADFASLVGISQPAVSQLLSRGIIKGNSVREWVLDYCTHLREIAAGRAGKQGDGLDLVSERARLAKAQADAQEMKNLTDRRELIRATDLEPRLAAAYITAREMWLDAVPRLARELPAEPAARETMLQNEFEGFLNRLADWAKAAEDIEDAE